MVIGTSLEGIGARLMDRRDAMGLSGTEVAKRAGISATTLYAIENGRTKPRGATLRRLARAFGVPVEELLTDTPKDRRSPLEQARVQAENLKRREAEGEDRGPDYWMGQYTTAHDCVDATAKLLREVGAEEEGRRAALQLLEDFIGLEGRALDRWLAVHGWSKEDLLTHEPRNGEQETASPDA